MRAFLLPTRLEHHVMSTTPDEAALHDEDGLPDDLPLPGWDAEAATPGTEEDDR